MTLSGCIGTYLILVLCSFCRTFLCLKCKESVSSEEVFLVNFSVPVRSQCTKVDNIQLRANSKLMSVYIRLERMFLHIKINDAH